MTGNTDTYRVTCAADGCGFEEAYDSADVASEAAGEHARAAGGDHIGVVEVPVGPVTDADGATGTEEGPDPLPAGSLITQSRTVIGPEDIDIDLDADPEDIDGMSDQDIQELLETIEAEIEAATPDDRGDDDGGAE